jgi:hypothetical protein
MPRALKTQTYILKSSKTAIPPFTYCIRTPDIKRRSKENADYRKGYETRISINDIEEVKILKGILRKKHITIGNPYKKHKRIILPIYGKENTMAFTEIITRAL